MNEVALNTGLALAILLAVAGGLATYTLLLDRAIERAARRFDRSIASERER